MKLRTKLIIAFFTIILVPIFIVYIGVSTFTNFQLRTMVRGYEGSGSGELFAGNAVQLISGMTAETLEQVKALIAEEPSVFDDADRLETMNADLRSSYSFLVVRAGEEFSYVGSDSVTQEFLDSLPAYGSVEDPKGVDYYTAENRDYLVKQSDFVNERGQTCSVFVVTAF